MRFVIVMLALLCSMPLMAQEKGELETVNFKDLTKKNNLFYKIGHTEPFTGQCIEYHLNEMPKGVAYIIDGKIEGRFVSYDEFGKKVGEARYLNGVRHGKETHYWPNGTVKREQSFKNGVLHGQYIEYNEKGQPTKSAEYQNGEPVAKTLYKDGKAVDTRRKNE